ncbi:hypothetical protein B0H13DRAFT_1649299, partial [Mycena leptocephala]
VRQALEGLAFIHERGIAHGGGSPVISSSFGAHTHSDLYLHQTLCQKLDRT